MFYKAAVMLLLSSALFTSGIAEDTAAVTMPSSLKSGSRPLCRSVAKCIAKLDKGEECELLPIPPRARLPPVAPGTFVLAPLRKGVWLYNDGVYLTLILKTRARLAVIDFPNSASSNTPDGSGTLITHAVERVLAGSVPKRVDMIYSHAHFDHIGAAARVYNFFEKKYPAARKFVWGTPETKELIEVSKAATAVAPNRIVTERRPRMISLGRGLTVKMTVVGGHTQQDLAIYIPRFGKEKGIVMYVDVVLPRWSPPLNLGLTQDVREYISAQKELLKLDFDVFVGGHFLPGTKRDVRLNIQYSEDLVQAAAKAVADVTQEDLVAGGIGKVADPTAPEFGNVFWAAFRVTRKLQVDICYRILLEKWGCTLAALDINLRSHCSTAISFIIVDVS